MIYIIACVKSGQSGGWTPDDRIRRRSWREERPNLNQAQLWAVEFVILITHHCLSYLWVFSVPSFWDTACFCFLYLDFSDWKSRHHKVWVKVKVSQFKPIPRFIGQAACPCLYVLLTGAYWVRISWAASYLVAMAPRHLWSEWEF